jgi:hypothetical protein
MSALLEAAAANDPRRAVDLARDSNGTLMAFLIRIGSRDKPRLEFGCVAASSARATEQHLDLCTPGERFEVIPVTGEPFMVSPVRQDIQVAMLKGAIRG